LGRHENVFLGAEANDYAGDAEEERLSPEFEEFFVLESMDLSICVEFAGCFKFEVM
jgi:hypothetical protein